MNKLQQEIIEIIEDYMDKTLSEGAVMRTDGRNFILIKSDIDSAIEELNGEFSDLKVIGHYDITAVLKYILLKRDCQIFTLPFIEGRIQDKLIIAPKQDGIYKRVSKYNFEIPNKPLNLYTEQENVSLLKLLKKVGTN